MLRLLANEALLDGFSAMQIDNDGKVLILPCYVHD